MDKNYIYNLEFIVRNYECDLQGIVNNAVYQHYLEHTRHEFMYSGGIDFAKLHVEGIDPVVTRVELDYKYSLKSQNRFVVCINVHRKGKLKFVFEQNVYRLPEEKLILKGRVTTVFLQNGRPILPDRIVADLLEKYKIE